MDITQTKTQAVERVNVINITAKEAAPWLLSRHYAKRMCPISFAFGAFKGSLMVGVVTFGVPSSAALRDGLAGKEWSNMVLELNRLCCTNEKNMASLLVGRSIKMLPYPSIIVSYADTAQGHVGYVYQATNFIYTGLSAKRTDWKVKGMEHLHGATIADKSRGVKDRAQWMRDTYGEDFYLEERSRKHRYIYLHGDRKQKAEMRAALKYDEEPYPKGESMRYEISSAIETQSALSI